MDVVEVEVEVEVALVALVAQKVEAVSVMAAPIVQALVVTATPLCTCPADTHTTHEAPLITMWKYAMVSQNGFIISFSNIIYKTFTLMLVEVGHLKRQLARYQSPLMPTVHLTSSLFCSLKWTSTSGACCQLIKLKSLLMYSSLRSASTKVQCFLFVFLQYVNKSF